MLFVVALEMEEADKDEKYLQIVVVEAESSEEAPLEAMRLSSLEDISSVRIVREFDSIEDSIVANIKVPYVSVSVW